MRKIFFVLSLLTVSVFAQKNINNYKYIVVPNKFDFVNKVDQYQTSSLTKFLFNKHGFTAFLAEDDLPSDLAENRCLALTAVVESSSSMFATRNVIILKDCANKTVYSSKEGKSKLKEYKKAYHEAIRNAFKSIKKMDYTYIETSSDEKSIIDKKVEVPAVLKIPETVVSEKPIIIKTTINVLYAQPTKNGFQLVDTKPTVIFQLMKTNVKDVFIIKDKNGILYKNKNNWIAEFYENDVKKTSEYQIKF